MDISIGLPNTISGVDGELIPAWAKRAEERGFHAVASLDRVVYPNIEAFVALSAAAAVTERVKLETAILLAPLRNTAILAKQALSLDELSGGRLVLALAVGAREDDYAAAGVDFASRGDRFDAQLEELRRIWSGEERGTAGAIGPRRDGGPELWIGGHIGKAFRRTARYASGWVAGGMPPDAFAQTVTGLKEAWTAEGRAGEPRTAALCYFALGPDAREHADRDLEHYYAWLGEYAKQIAQSAIVDADMAAQYRDGFAQAGCDELICFPTKASLEQVDLLADAML